MADQVPVTSAFAGVALSDDLPFPGVLALQGLEAHLASRHLANLHGQSFRTSAEVTSALEALLRAKDPKPALRALYDFFEPAAATTRSATLLRAWLADALFAAFATVVRVGACATALTGVVGVIDRAVAAVRSSESSVPRLPRVSTLVVSLFVRALAAPCGSSLAARLFRTAALLVEFSGNRLDDAVGRELLAYLGVLESTIEAKMRDSPGLLALDLCSDLLRFFAAVSCGNAERQSVVRQRARALLGLLVDNAQLRKSADKFEHRKKSAAALALAPPSATSGLTFELPEPATWPDVAASKALTRALKLAGTLVYLLPDGSAPVPTRSADRLERALHGVAEEPLVAGPAALGPLAPASRLLEAIDGCPNNLYVVGAALRALANTLYADKAARGAFAAGPGLETVLANMRRLGAGPSQDETPEVGDLRVAALLAAAEVLSNVAYNDGALQRDLVEKRDLVALTTSALGAISAVRGDTAQRRRDTVDVLSSFGNCVTLLANEAPRVDVKHVVGVLADLCTNQPPTACTAPILVATALVPLHAAWAKATFDWSADTFGAERLGAMKGVCDVATLSMKPALLGDSSFNDPTALALLELAIRLSSALQLTIAQVAASAVIMFWAHQEALPGWHPADVTLLHDLCARAVRPDVVGALYESMRGRDCSDPSAGAMVDAVAQRSLAEVILDLLRWEKGRLGAQDGQEDDQDGSDRLMRALDATFRPDFAAAARAFVARGACLNMEERIAHDADALGLAWTAGPYGAFLTSLPAQNGSLRHPSAPSQALHFYKIPPDLYASEWHPDPERAAAALLEDLYTARPDLRRGHRMYFHATTHAGANGILCANENTPPFYAAGMHCKFGRTDFSPRGAAYYHTTFHGAYLARPRPMAILVYALPDAVRTEMTNTLGWRTYDDANERWTRFVRRCRVIQRPVDPLADPIAPIVEGPVAIGLAVNRESLVRDMQEPDVSVHNSLMTQVALCLTNEGYEDTQTEAMRVVDRHLVAVVAFSARIVEAVVREL